jgi:predicted SnoaL-like aldol condensation-catalyzing enzyme
MVNWVHANMKDMKTEKVREVADGDFVYSWMRYTGTSDGTMGMPNGPYDMQAIEVAKYRDGKAIEHWNFAEIQAMMKMMPQPTMNSMDTSTMKK